MAGLARTLPAAAEAAAEADSQQHDRLCSTHMSSPKKGSAQATRVTIAT